MSDTIRQRLEAAALKAEKQEEQEYWNREYSGDVELAQAKQRIKELEDDVVSSLDLHCQLKSIAWNLNRIANAIEDVSPNHTAGERILRQLRRGNK
jgi:hypothetical protein|tara:strand:+ start:151 stop:438 length:288 start_codon:yes stop_codon:yes gene_type:complete